MKRLGAARAYGEFDIIYSRLLFWSPGSFLHQVLFVFFLPFPTTASSVLVYFFDPSG